MMNGLLRYLRTMPLTLAACEAFLLRAAMLAVTGELSVDNWVYLAHLVVYRTTTRLHASDKDKERMASLMRQIEEQKNTLGGAYN